MAFEELRNEIAAGNKYGGNAATNSWKSQNTTNDMNSYYQAPPVGAGSRTPVGNPYASGGLGSLKSHIAAGGDLDYRSIAMNMPEYSSIMNSWGGLKKGFEFNPQGVGPYGGKNGLASYNKLNAFATGTGPGEYSRNAGRVIDLATKKGLSGVREESARSLAGGMSNLAATGGLTSGAGERLQQSSNLARINAGQNLYANAASSNAEAAMQEGQMRLGALGQVTGMDVDRLKTNNTIANQGKLVNVNNMIQDQRGGNLFNMEGWGKLGDIYGSEMAARAMEAAANKEAPGLLGMGGFLGTGIGGDKGLLGTGILGGGRLIDTRNWGISL